MYICGVIQVIFFRLEIWRKCQLESSPVCKTTHSNVKTNWNLCAIFSNSFSLPIDNLCFDFVGLSTAFCFDSPVSAFTFATPKPSHCRCHFGIPIFSQWLFSYFDYYIVLSFFLLRAQNYSRNTQSYFYFYRFPSAQYRFLDFCRRRPSSVARPVPSSLSAPSPSPSSIMYTINNPNILSWIIAVFVFAAESIALDFYGLPRLKRNGTKVSPGKTETLHFQFWCSLLMLDFHLDWMPNKNHSTQSTECKLIRSFTFNLIIFAGTSADKLHFYFGLVHWLLFEKYHNFVDTINGSVTTEWLLTILCGRKPIRSDRIGVTDCEFPQQRLDCRCAESDYCFVTKKRLEFFFLSKSHLLA